jgi:hypothetical protein
MRAKRRLRIDCVGVVTSREVDCRGLVIPSHFAGKVVDGSQPKTLHGDFRKEISFWFTLGPAEWSVDELACLALHYTQQRSVYQNNIEGQCGWQPLENGGQEEAKSPRLFVVDVPERWYEALEYGDDERSTIERLRRRNDGDCRFRLRRNDVAGKVAAAYEQIAVVG